MSQEIEFPLALKAWIEYVQGELQELQGRTTVRVTDKVVQDATFVRLRRIGGPLYDRFTDFPMIAVDVYDEDTEAAERFARDVRKIIHRASGRRLYGTVSCKRISETSGPYDNPDEDHSSARVSWAFQSRLREVTTQGESNGE